LVCACVPLVFSAATLVVTVVLLETLVSLDAEPDELEKEEEAFCVVVDVYVEPALFVLVITIGTRLVKPIESVDTEVTVEGDPETVVVLHFVTGYAKAIMLPDWVVVIVSVVTDPASVVVEAAGKVQLAVPHPYPDGQQPPPTLAAHPKYPEAQLLGFAAVDAAAPLAGIVTVIVTCAARLEAWFSAFRIAEAGIGAPAKSHAH